MEKLTEFLKGVEKLEPSSCFTRNSSKRLMNHVNNWTWDFFIIRILNKISPVKISLYMKNDVRNRILAFVKKRTFLENLRYFISSVVLKWILIPTLMASFFFVFIIWVNTTSAEFESQVFLVKWRAQIKHLWGIWKNISQNEILNIRDRIKSDSDSLVEIFYYDNSVSRIAENSVVSISSLASNPYKNLPTILKVENWRVWNKVISSLSFQVETTDAHISTQKWVFDVKKDLITEIAAISNSLDVKMIWAKNMLLSKRIWAWYWIKTSSFELSKIKKWRWEIENNLADNIYKDRLISKIADNAVNDVSILPSNKLYFAKKKLEDLSNENIVSVIKKRLQELKVLTLNSIWDLSLKNINTVEELKVTLNSDEKANFIIFLNKELWKLGVILPWHNLYQYKLYISSLLLELDDTWVYQKQMVLDRINEAQEIALSTNDTDNLLVALNQFSRIVVDIDTDIWINKLKSSLASKNDVLFALQSLENLVDKWGKVSKIVRKEKIKIAYDIKQIVKEIAPQKNGEFIQSTNDTAYFAKQIHDFLDRINRYSSDKSRENTLYWILENLPCDKNNLEFLYSFREKLDENLASLVSKAILKTMRCE